MSVNRRSVKYIQSSIFKKPVKDLLSSDDL